MIVGTAHSLTHSLSLTHTHTHTHTQVVDEKEAERLAKKMVSDNYDFEDFMSQSRAIKQMGSLGGTLPKL